MSVEEPFEGVRPKMNNLPDTLFMNVNYEEGIYGIGADGLYVCPDHNGRALPCRTCLYREVATTPYMFFRDYNNMLVFDALHSAFEKYSDDHNAWYYHPNAYGTATIDGKFDLDELASLIATTLHEKGFR